MRVLRVAEQRTQQETGISTAQMLVLQQLDGVPALSLTELAERTSTDRSSVTDVVERLVERRYVRRVRDPRDARRAAVSITQKGRALIRRAARSPSAVLVAGLSGLTPSQLAMVGRSLEHLSRALDAHS
jgi:DNA-binding MarR family transcriptional regulator